MFPGLWRHGDWIRVFPDGTSVIGGRADSTLNRHGIRMVTAKLYRVVEAAPDVLDSLVVDLEFLGRPFLLALFVVLPEGQALDPAWQARIRHDSRTQASPRRVPDRHYQLQDIPPPSPERR